MQHYSDEIKARVKAAPKTIGTQLIRLTIKRDIPITQLSLITGACRQTLYKWAGGSRVSNAYKTHVLQLIAQLKAAKDSK